MMTKYPGNTSEREAKLKKTNQAEKKLTISESTAPISLWKVSNYKSSEQMEKVIKNDIIIIRCSFKHTFAFT